MKKTDLITIITEQLNNLTETQIDTLFHLYLELNCKYEFFMREKDFSNLMNFYYERILIKTIESYRTFLYIAITKYTYQSKYFDLLQIFDMLKKECSFDEIIFTFCPY